MEGTECVYVSSRKLMVTPPPMIILTGTLSVIIQLPANHTLRWQRVVAISLPVPLKQVSYWFMGQFLAQQTTYGKKDQVFFAASRRRRLYYPAPCVPGVWKRCVLRYHYNDARLGWTKSCVLGHQHQCISSAQHHTDEPKNAHPVGVLVEDLTNYCY